MQYMMLERENQTIKLLKIGRIQIPNYVIYV